jgi:hypothetical protein
VIPADSGSTREFIDKPAHPANPRKSASIRAIRGYPGVGVCHFFALFSLLRCTSVVLLFVFSCVFFLLVVVRLFFMTDFVAAPLPALVRTRSFCLFLSFFLLVH